MTTHFPIFIDLENKPVLVVGAGHVARRKIHSLIRAGANLTLVAPDIDQTLENGLEGVDIVYRRREFQNSDIDNKTLVIAATNDANINQHIAELAKQQHIPVNVANKPSAGTFIFPSVVNRDPINIAISTGGHSPVLARLLRIWLQAFIPKRIGELAQLMKDYRSKVKAKFTDRKDRQQFWQQCINGPLSEALFHNKPERARAILDRTLTEYRTGDDRQNTGEVYLVGAGPGDPDLLTFRALRLIQQADVVLYDRLVSQGVLELIPEQTETIYVGKAQSRHAVPQIEINQKLIDLAKQGKKVLRLKGGDPFIFGRGGEEIEQLTHHDIPFQIVPGITAGSGCAAYAGIPLTHRDYAHSCVFVAGHSKDGQLDLNWPALVQPRQTIVVYMGLIGLEILSNKLIEHGLSGKTPAALVERGTTPDHRVITSTLSSLTEDVQNARVQPPTLIIIGEVVKLREQLRWFEN